MGAQAGLLLGVVLALGVLALLAGIPGGDGAVVAHYAGPDFAGLAFVVIQVVCRHGFYCSQLFRQATIRIDCVTGGGGGVGGG